MDKKEYRLSGISQIEWIESAYLHLYPDLNIPEGHLLKSKLEWDTWINMKYLALQFLYSNRGMLATGRIN